MKKILSITSSAALALILALSGVSCKKQALPLSVEQGGQYPLTFSASALLKEDGNGVTRASVTTSEELPANFTIHSTAWLVPVDGSRESTYFYDEPFRRKSTGVWESDAYKYWPVGGKLEFLCIAVDDDVMPLSDFDAFKWNDTKSTASVTVDIPNTQKMQSEVMFASANPESKNESVNLKFSHSQAQLEFSFKLAQAADNSLIRLDSLTIGNVFMLGKLKVTNRTPATLSASWNFSYAYPVTAYVPDVKGTVVELTAKNRILLVPAQPVGVVTLFYTRRNLSTDDWSRGTTFAATLTPKQTRWEMGVKYTYNIQFNHNDFTLTTDDGDITVSEYTGDWNKKLEFEN